MECFSRPNVTLSYSQSLDGCLAYSARHMCKLSGMSALRLTHRLRSEHDAILVGIGTVLADDPQLTVRYYKGKSPQPVIIDTHLRIPLSSKLIRQNPSPLWIASGDITNEKKCAALKRKKALIMPISLNANGGLDLFVLLHKLKQRGIKNLMVEGGAKIITSFLNNRLVDKIVLTIVPIYLGGLHAYKNNRKGKFNNPLPRLKILKHFLLGKDIIIEGRPIWKEPKKLNRR